jgi:hypothetical protein
MKRIAFCTVGLAALMTTACQDHSNLYDSDYANAVKQQEYSQSFPVQNIDPTQDWNLYTTANVQVTVNEDWGETYTVKVYTANPLDETSGALLLAKGEVKNGETFSTQISVPKAQEGVYVSRLSKQGEKLVKYVSLSGDKSVVFGSPNSTRAYTGDDPYITAHTESCPYTLDEIQSFIDQAYEVTESDDWTSLNNKTYLKISKSITIPSGIHGSPYVVITNGAEVTYANSTDMGSAIIIVENGTLVLSGSTNNLGNTTRMVILEKGVVKSTSSSMQILSPNTYNAGLITGSYVGVTSLYNCGTIDVDDLGYGGWLASFTFYNNGKLIVSGTFNDNNGSFYNNCYAEINEIINVTTFTLADNSHIKSRTFAVQNNANIYIGKGAILEVEGEVSLNSPWVHAPENSTGANYEDYAFIKFGSVGYANIGSSNFSGHYVIDPGDYSKCSCGASWFESYVLQKSGVVVGEFTFDEPTESSEACSGLRKPDTTTPEEDDNNDQSDYVYYAFEDLGSIGDYDFNDVVLRVYDADEDGNAKVELVAAGGKLTVSVVYGSQTLWSDVHGADAFNTTDYVNVGTNEYNSNYPTKTINIGSTPKHQLYNLQLVVQNESGTSQQLASTVVSSKADTGKAPQALIIPAGWKWPTELQSLCKVYNTEDFSIIDWMENKDSSVNWYLNVKSGYESLVVTPK